MRRARLEAGPKAAHFNLRSWTAWRISCSFPLAAIPVLLLASLAALAQPRPNIILAMGDDHGWHETSYNGHPHLRTPALDAMAVNGFRFDRFYAAAPMCTPTRGSVMTGRHPNRFGAFAPNHSIRPEEITIAQILRKAGYRTGHFGKWHLGPARAGAPTNPGAMGFDEWLSHDNFFGYNPRFNRNGGAPERFPGESSEIIVTEAIKFIEAAVEDGMPFFTVVWFGSPHEPYSGIDEDMIPFRDMVELDRRLRHRLGEIVALDRSMEWLRSYLRDAGLAGNTLLWYTSDNGAPREGCVWTKLRGHKGNLYEGGIRAPSVIEYPAMIEQARSTSVPAVTSDILPTLCDLLDLELPDRVLDGISLVPLITGEATERPVPIPFWAYDRGAREETKNEPWIEPALQHGNLPTSKRYTIEFVNFRHPVARTSDFGGRTAMAGNRFKLVVPADGPAELYDIVADIEEKHDVSAKHPEIVKELESKLRDWQKSVEVSLTGAEY